MSVADMHQEYCKTCKQTTTHFKDMCMKCGKKHNVVSDLFGGLFKGGKK